MLEEAAKEISSKTGGTVLPVQLDIRDPAAVGKAVDQIETELGLPNVVVHNAAGNFISPTERLSANAFQTIIDIVLKGTGFLTLDVGKRMIAQQSGGVFLAITTLHFLFKLHLFVLFLGIFKVVVGIHIEPWMFEHL